MRHAANKIVRKESQHIVPARLRATSQQPAHVATKARCPAREFVLGIVDLLMVQLPKVSRA